MDSKGKKVELNISPKINTVLDKRWYYVSQKTNYLPLNSSTKQKAGNKKINGDE